METLHSSYHQPAGTLQESHTVQFSMLQRLMTSAQQRGTDTMNPCAGLQMSGDEWGVLQEILQTHVRLMAAASMSNLSKNFEHISAEILI
jgi:hypothetical protein